MGHRDTDMIIRVYSKYIDGGQKDGNNFDAAYQGILEKKNEWTVKVIFGKIMAKTLQNAKKA